MAEMSSLDSGTATVIVHLSDLHAGNPFDENLAHQLLDEIPRYEPHVIIVSGDLADQPRPRWLRMAARFLHDLRDRCQQSPTGRRPALLVVPGNHDVKIYGNVSAGFWGRMYFDVYFADCNEQLSLPTFFRRIQRYAKWISKTTWASLLERLGVIRSRPSGVKPWVLAGNNLIVVSYDSNDTIFSARGRVRPEQISETRAALDRVLDSQADPMALRIALVHHHPLPIPYADAKSITNLEGFLVMENAGTFMREMVVHDFDLVLHGHKHFSNFSRISYQLSPIERAEIGVLAAGTATVRGGNQDRKNSFNVIRLYDPGRAEIEIWEYGAGRSRQYAQHSPYSFELHTVTGYKLRAFRLNWKTHQVRAKRLTIRKELFSDGRAKVTHRIEGLVVGDRVVDGYESYYVSDTGLVRCPELSAESARAGLTLERSFERRNEKAAAAKKENESEQTGAKRISLSETEESLRQAQSFTGMVHFNRAVNRVDQLTDFEFSFYMVNCDALSDWEYELLYAKKDHTDAILHPAQDLLEWFEQIIWFPVEQLRMIVELPDVITSTPFLDVFRIPEFPVDVDRGAIIRQRSQELRGKERQRDAYLRSASEDSLVRRKGNSWLLTVDHPPVGRGYAICWGVPKSEPRRVASSLISQAEVFRGLLLNYREGRLKDPEKVASDARVIRSMFAELFLQLREQYPCLDPGEEFDLVMMGYDAQNRRLKVIEGVKNGQELPKAYWDFWLPAGVGNAGSCFKTSSARIYVAEEISPEYDYYLPVSGTTPHKVLVSLPVDHPKFAQAAGSIGKNYSNDRRRQVVAVFNVGSSCKASELRRLHPDPVLGIAQEVASNSEIVQLQQIFQGVLNEIWDILTTRAIDKDSQTT